MANETDYALTWLVLERRRLFVKHQPGFALAMVGGLPAHGESKALLTSLARGCGSRQAAGLGPSHQEGLHSRSVHGHSEALVASADSQVGLCPLFAAGRQHYRRCPPARVTLGIPELHGPKPTASAASTSPSAHMVTQQYAPHYYMGAYSKESMQRIAA